MPKEEGAKSPNLLEWLNDFGVGFEDQIETEAEKRNNRKEEIQKARRILAKLQKPKQE